MAQGALCEGTNCANKAPADLFVSLEPDPNWAFWHLTPGQTNYATHGYHRYPAKFIPQLAARLIHEYSCEKDLIIDPFMGSGTTLVEAKLSRRLSLGVDINPVAYSVSRAKVNAIEPMQLKKAVENVRLTIHSKCQPSVIRQESLPVRSLYNNKRLSYWFPQRSLSALMQIHGVIESLERDDLKVFFHCALSHCLKPLSWWSDRSVKPTRKLDKPIPDAYTVFIRHVKRMERGNEVFWRMLSERDALTVQAEPYCSDARHLPLADGLASLIVTSPPYVTSYEYADLHQLSALWFGAMTNLKEFRKGFIGRSNGIEEIDGALGSALAEKITAEVAQRNPRKAKEVARYFVEMRQSFVEMWRVLRSGGRVCIVIGNTHLYGVEIQNAQVFAEQLLGLGFELERIILREVPSKVLPRTRDRQTGRFAKTAESDYIAYPTEYILIMRK